MKRIIAGLLLFIATTAAADQPKGEKVDYSRLPIDITSNELFSDTKAKTATFVGKVVAKQGDITITCDKMVVYSSPQDQGQPQSKAKAPAKAPAKSKGQDQGQSQVDRVECFGNVRIVQVNRLGVAGHALYESKSGRIIMTENPKVYQDNDVVAGTVITYYIAEEKSVATSAPGTRVQAVIHPKGKEDDGGKH